MGGAEQSYNNKHDKAIKDAIASERDNNEKQLDDLKIKHQTILEELKIDQSEKLRELQHQIASGDALLKKAIDERQSIEVSLTVAQSRIRECEERAKIVDEKLQRRGRRIKSLVEANLCAICKVNKVINPF